MIDYQKNRERQEKATDIKGKYDEMIVITDASIYLSKNGLESRCHDEEEDFILGLINDAETLLDKAEAHDKAVERVEKLEDIIENIHAAAKDSPISYEQIIQICSELIEGHKEKPSGTPLIPRRGE